MSETTPETTERDEQLRTLWRSVTGPYAELTGPLIRFAGLVRDDALREAQVTPPPRLEVHRCKNCGTRWLRWTDASHGQIWNLLDQWQRPGSCCDNAPMGEQIEYLRDISSAHLDAVPASLEVTAKVAIEMLYNGTAEIARLRAQLRDAARPPSDKAATTGEDFWMDELEFQLGKSLTPTGRDHLRSWLRAFAAHVKRQAGASPVRDPDGETR